MTILLSVMETNNFGAPVRALQGLVDDAYRITLLGAFTEFLCEDLREVVMVKFKATKTQAIIKAFLQQYKNATEEQIAEAVKTLADKYSKGLFVKEDNGKQTIRINKFTILDDLTSDELLLRLETGAPGVPVAELRRELTTHVSARISELWEDFKKEFAPDIDNLLLSSMMGG